MLVSNDAALIEHARKLSTQAREPAPHYEHTEIGYNYRLSNLLAAVGRAQLATLDERVAARRRNFGHYVAALRDVDGVEFMPEPDWSFHSRWLTTCLLDSDVLGVTPEEVRLRLEENNIEARPVWKPMHAQPVFRDCEIFGGAVADDLFARGLCLPSGSSLTQADIHTVIDASGLSNIASLR
jgi:dTDP-4-amino-4,6-dideoxygalactose transaminase